MIDDPQRIYQAQLERGSRATILGDVEAMLTLTALPVQIVLADCDIVVATEADLATLVRGYAARLKAEGVVEAREWCTGAAYVTAGADLVAGTHVTEWRHADGRAPYRFVNRLVMMQFGEGWKSLWLHSGLNRSQVEAICPHAVAARAAKLRAAGALHR
jgi:hypothetical protein